MNDYAAHRMKEKPLDIVKPYVTVARVPAFEWVVFREDCLAQRTPFEPRSNCCIPRVEFQIYGLLVCA